MKWEGGGVTDDLDIGWPHSWLCMALCIQEWERRYLLTKARHLHDASLDDDVTQSLAHHHHPSSSSTSTVVTRGQVKRARIKATPAYLQERVEKNRPLPKVEVASVAGGGEEGQGQEPAALLGHGRQQDGPDHRAHRGGEGGSRGGAGLLCRRE